MLGKSSAAMTVLFLVLASAGIQGYIASAEVEQFEGPFIQYLGSTIGTSNEYAYREGGTGTGIAASSSKPVRDYLFNTQGKWPVLHMTETEQVSLAYEIYADNGQKLLLVAGKFPLGTDAKIPLDVTNAAKITAKGWVTTYTTAEMYSPLPQFGGQMPDLLDKITESGKLTDLRAWLTIADMPYDVYVDAFARSDKGTYVMILYKDNKPSCHVKFTKSESRIEIIQSKVETRYQNTGQCVLSKLSDADKELLVAVKAAQKRGEPAIFKPSPCKTATAKAKKSWEFATECLPSEGYKFDIKKVNGQLVVLVTRIRSGELFEAYLVPKGKTQKATKSEINVEWH